MKNISGQREIIQFMRPTKAPQSSGQRKEVGEPTLIHECWAVTKITNGSELENFDQNKANYSYETKIRFTTTELFETDFYIHKGKRVEISSIIPVPEDDEIHVTGTR